jgi:hypothetical protein
MTGFALLMSMMLIASARESVAVAEATGSGNGNCQAFGLIDQDNFTTTANVATQACDVTFLEGSKFGQALVNVGTYFVENPQVDVQTSAFKEGGSGLVQADGTGMIQYETSIGFKATPPFILTEYPVTLQAPYSMNDFGTPGVSAAVFLTVTQPEADIFFQEFRVFGTDPAEDEYFLQGEVAVIDPVIVTIEATCVSNAPEDESSDCQAIMDPIFTFDQAEFDATHGANSYVLDEFLQFNQSTNLVPEPSWTAGVMAGVVALCGFARRGAQS